MKKKIPVIDLFAGPGGLGEGFSSYKGKFKIGLSVEKDSTAHRTLKLRAFYRQFPDRKPPDVYYSVLRGELTDLELFSNKDQQPEKIKNALVNAEEEALCATLGEIPVAELDKRITEALNGYKDWVLIGGPPCQAYSLAGRSRNIGKKEYVPEKDTRHFLYKEYLRVIAKHEPTVFIMENVKGLLSSKVGGKLVFNQMIVDLKNPSAVSGKKNKSSYIILSLSADMPKQPDMLTGREPDPHEFLVRCENYGIPQSRHRVILMGIREDHWGKAFPGSLRKSEPATLYDVLKDLPVLRSGISKDWHGKSSINDTMVAWQGSLSNITGSRWFRSATIGKDKKIFKKIIVDSVKTAANGEITRGAEYMPAGTYTRWAPRARLKREFNEWYIDINIKGVCNSSTRGHMESDLSRYMFAACYGQLHKSSPVLKDLPADLQPKHKNAKSDHFNDRFRVQLQDQPSSTITCHISKDGHYYIHPDPAQCRSLTVREAARLQTFPDNYFFCGNRTEQYRQVGNAVPPLLARQIAEIVYDFLN